MSDEEESIRETEEILADPEAMRQIQESRADIAGGRLVTSEELEERYLKRHPPDSGRGS